jgi:polysaccharide pyruvyl transferase WcaK-like protein
LIGKNLGKHILKRIEKLYVRDDKAFGFIDELVVDKQLEIDMAVYMRPEKISHDIKPKTVGINISGLMYLNRYKSLEGKYENYPIFLQKLVKRMLDDGFEVLLIPHTYNAIKPNDEDDLEGIKKFLIDYPDLAKRISYIDKDYSAPELKHIISKTVFFMGSRMHSCIAALSTSVPTIGLSYSYKFEGTFDMFKQKSLVMDVNYLKEDTIEAFINKISNIISNADAVKSVLLEENNRKPLVL